MDAKTFFYTHAGYSYDPKTETAEQGRTRCAEHLARAEAWAGEQCLSFEWQIDPDVTSADWRGARQDGGKYCNPWRTWMCLAHDESGAVIDSLGGVDFGRDGEPWGNPHRRVCEAEIAAGLMGG